jgi:hypothetical protein
MLVTSIRYTEIKQRSLHQRPALSVCNPSVTFPILSLSPSKSRVSSVGIALGYGLDDRGSRLRFPAGAGNFSVHHSVQNCSGAHPAS